MWEKGGNFYGLHRSIQGTHHVFFQRFLQSRHTLCRHVYTVLSVNQNNSIYRYIVFWKGENWVKVFITPCNLKLDAV